MTTEPCGQEKTRDIGESDSWPSAFNGGEQISCQKTSLALYAMGDDAKWAQYKTRNLIRNAIIGSSGKQLRGWEVAPLVCGDYTCCNHHHWRAVRRAVKHSRSRPSQPGFVKITDDEMTKIEALVCRAPRPEKLRGSSSELLYRIFGVEKAARGLETDL